MTSIGERLAHGDQAAFADLYDAYAPRLHRYLLIRLGFRADADDALQETFVALARGRARLARVDNLAAYVFAAARHEAQRLQERRCRRARVEAVVGRRVEAAEPASDPGDVEWAVSALDRLRPDQREVVELKLFAGLTFREIADVTGTPQGTAATRYRAAMEHLRAELTREAGA